MGAAEIPRFYVFNKLDRLDSFPNSDELARWSGGQPWAVLSTHDSEAVAKLETALLQAVRREEAELTAFIPYAASALLKLILFARAPAVELLILDEPTFSLDLLGQRALTQALCAWRGALVVASHDREFLAQIGVERTIRLGPTQ